MSLPSHAAVCQELSELTLGKPPCDDFGFDHTSLWSGLTCLAYWLSVRQKMGVVLEFDGNLL